MSVLAAASAIGTPSIIAYTMISLVLMPLKLPAGIIILLLIVLDPIIDPLGTVLNIYLNSVITAVISKEKVPLHAGEENVS